MSSMQREKGKIGEREFAEFLRDHGFPGACRGQQFSGLGGEDVVGLPGFHVEVKRTEALRLYPALAQSVRDSNPARIPVVAHRSNRREWVVILRAEDFCSLVRRMLAQQAKLRGDAATTQVSAEVAALRGDS